MAVTMVSTVAIGTVTAMSQVSWSWPARMVAALPYRPDDRQIGRRRGQIVEQRSLPDPRLAAQYQRPALTAAYR